MPNKTPPQNEHLNPFEYDFCEFASMENLENDEKCFLFHVKSSVRSQDN